MQSAAAFRRPATGTPNAPSGSYPQGKADLEDCPHDDERDDRGDYEDEDRQKPAGEPAGDRLVAEGAATDHHIVRIRLGNDLHAASLAADKILPAQQSIATMRTDLSRVRHVLITFSALGQHEHVP